MTTPPLGFPVKPDNPKPLIPLTPAQHVRLKIGTMSDCLQRALDGLTFDDDSRIDWRYVAKQLDLVAEICWTAHDIVTQRIDASGIHAEPTSDTPAVPQNAGLMNLNSDGPYQGDKR